MSIQLSKIIHHSLNILIELRGHLRPAGNGKTRGQPYWRVVCLACTDYRRIAEQQRTIPIPTGSRPRSDWRIWPRDCCHRSDPPLRPFPTQQRKHPIPKNPNRSNRPTCPTRRNMTPRPVCALGIRQWFSHHSRSASVHDIWTQISSPMATRFKPCWEFSRPDHQSSGVLQYPSLKKWVEMTTMTKSPKLSCLLWETSLEDVAAAVRIAITMSPEEVQWR